MNAKVQLSFIRKRPLFEKTQILPSLLVDAHDLVKITFLSEQPM